MGNATISRPTYVYGVVRSASIPELERQGLDGAAVRTVAFEHVAALVRTSESVPVKATRASLLAHTEVLQHAMEHSTVLPIRFGFVMDDDDAVRDFLHERYTELHDLLVKFDGRVELNVKAYYVEEALLREIVSENAAIADLREVTRKLPGDAGYYQRIRLGEMIAAAMRAKRVEDAALIVGRLGRLAVSSEQEADVPERTVLKAAFLVERHRAPAFQDAVAQLASELSARMQFKCVGPLPPYSFVSFSPAAEAALDR